MSLIRKFFGNNINKIITIDGEYGSGYSEIAKEIAKTLNIKLYDEKLIELMALEKNVKPEDVSKDDSFLQGTIYDLYRENYSYSQEDMAVNDAAFLLEARIIRDIAKDGFCVICGKCADYILESSDILSVFIHASEDFKRKRIENVYGISSEKVESKMKREDNKKSNHYNRSTNREWGRSEFYNISIESSSFEISDISKMIIELAKRKK